MPVLEDLIQTLTNLGGEGTLGQIYNEYAKISDNPKESTVRHYLQIYSSDSKKNYRNKGDYFFSIGVYGGGRWGLRNFEIPVQNEINLVAIADRQRISINRIVRDTALSASVKELVGYKCQLCEEKLLLHNGKSYVEAHHIKGLGEPHNGPDIQGISSFYVLIAT